MNRNLHFTTVASFFLFTQETHSFVMSSCPHVGNGQNSIPIIELNAMERLHDPSANAYGPLEHVYCLDDINEITQKIADDEWIALGSAIAEAMLETLFEIGANALKAMGKVDRAKSEERMAKGISIAVEVRVFDFFIKLLFIFFTLPYVFFVSIETTGNIRNDSRSTDLSRAWNTTTT